MIKDILFDKAVIGEFGKNVGLGIFIYGLYGISNGNIEVFNLVDILVGIIGMAIGIVLKKI